MDAEDQFIGDTMILQILAASDAVNEQEREVLYRWLTKAKRPSLSDPSVTSETVPGEWGENCRYPRCSCTVNLFTGAGCQRYRTPAAPSTGAPESDAPDQRNRGLLQAAKQALSALDRHATGLPWGQPGYPVPTPGADLLCEASSYLRPAIEREEAFRAAIAAESGRAAISEAGSDGVPPTHQSQEK